jgi:hypothetical protein
VEEVVADEFFVVVDGRRADERIAEVGVEVAPVGVVGAEELLVDVGQAARELQVGEEALAVIDALFAVVIEAEVKDAGFECLVRVDAFAKAHTRSSQASRSASSYSRLTSALGASLRR